MAAYQVLIVGAGFSGAETAFWLAQKGVRVGLLTQSLDAVMMPFLPPKPPFPREAFWKGLTTPRTSGSGPSTPGPSTSWKGLGPSTSSRPRPRGFSWRETGWWGSGPGRAPGPGEKVVLAVGSFLGARLFLGGVVEEAGRLSEASYPDLLEDLSRLGFRFVEREGEVPETPSTPGYRVRYLAFHPEEWEEKTFRLKRLEGLYAVGLCVREGDYARMSEEGKRLAEHLLHELG